LDILLLFYIFLFLLEELIRLFLLRIIFLFRLIGSLLLNLLKCCLLRWFPFYISLLEWPFYLFLILMEGLVRLFLLWIYFLFRLIGCLLLNLLLNNMILNGYIFLGLGLVLWLQSTKIFLHIFILKSFKLILIILYFEFVFILLFHHWMLKILFGCLMNFIILKHIFL